MKKEKATILVESLLALIIISFSLTIAFLSPAKLYQLAYIVRVKTSIYDVSYSIAEELVASSNINTQLSGKKIINKDLTYDWDCTYAILPFVFNSASTPVKFATLTVNTPDNRYKIQMNIILK